MIRPAMFLSENAENALAAGLPIGADGEPADPNKFGLLTNFARLSGGMIQRWR